MLTLHFHTCQGEWTVKTANARTKAAVTNVAAATVSLGNTLGPHRSLLTHRPPVERAHEGEDAVVRAPGGLEPRDIRHEPPA